jgi:hypothetical protein
VIDGSVVGGTGTEKKVHKAREEITEADMEGIDTDPSKNFARRRRDEQIFHKLSQIFNGLHWAMGITTLPTTATPRDERSFVLMWLVVIALVIVFLTGFFYFLLPLLGQ